MYVCGRLHPSHPAPRSTSCDHLEESKGLLRTISYHCFVAVNTMCAGLEEADMIAVRIRSQQAADVIGTAGRLFRLPLNLSHVKRVRKESGATELQVIICAANPHHASPPPAVTSSTPGTTNCEDQNAHNEFQNQDDKPVTGYIPSAVCPIGSLR